MCDQTGEFNAWYQDDIIADMQMDVINLVNNYEQIDDDNIDEVEEEIYSLARFHVYREEESFEDNRPILTSTDCGPFDDFWNQIVREALHSVDFEEVREDVAQYFLDQLGHICEDNNVDWLVD